MNRKPKSPESSAELRRRAERQLGARQPKPAPSQTFAENQRQLHELEVHQIELELQNAELQKVADALEVALEKYTDLYDFAPVGYLTLDREGTIREANLATAGLLGITRSVLMSRRLGLYVAAADRPAFNTFLTRVFASKNRESCEVSLLQDEKSPLAVRIEAAVAASGQECRAVLEDITKHRQAEADRLILNKLESTGILAGGIAHDFNNLLTVILLNVELAQTQLAPDAEVSQLLEQARRAALSAQRLTQQLIVFASGGTATREVVALAGVIQESVRHALSGSRVRGELSLAEELWAAEVNEGQFGQVIHNVVLNAREAMPQGGVVTVRAENVVLTAREIPSLSPGEYIQISITDQGVGIPPNELSKIFDPYFSTKRRGSQKGMGLGLTICHSIVHKHGGAMALESKPGIGTTFRIYFPASRKLLPQEKSPLPVCLPPPGRILVMEDEEEVRKLVASSLRRMGHEVELAEHGQMAIEIYQQAMKLDRPFDVVLLNLTVRGGMGGQETIQALLTLDPAVKAIAMSGYVHDPVILEPKAHGFKGILAKPFDVGKLQEMLSQVLDSSPASRGAP